MDETTFAHLRPKERTRRYAARVQQFLEHCPQVGGYEWSMVATSCKSIDFGDGLRWKWQTDNAQYRMQTKLRRFAVRNIVRYLTELDMYGNSELEAARDQLVGDGKELIGIYDAIIAACT
ncbi:MAG TPA: hypothetical protein VFV87_11100 [Pirellulaceae bacterium]|nr:hypothetical protein [Pirellulaceae bacterium]